jgi:hypothetical protein
MSGGVYTSFCALWLVRIIRGQVSTTFVSELHKPANNRFCLLTCFFVVIFSFSLKKCFNVI